MKAEFASSYMTENDHHGSMWTAGRAERHESEGYVSFRLPHKTGGGVGKVSGWLTLMYEEHAVPNEHVIFVRDQVHPERAMSGVP